MRIARAVTSKYVRAEEPPSDAVTRALEGLAALNEADQAARLFGFLEPPGIGGHWYAPDRTLTVALHGARFSAMGYEQGGHRVVTWRWTTLQDEGDWYEMGWLPDEWWPRVADPWKPRLWRAINHRDVWRLMS